MCTIVFTYKIRSWCVGIYIQWVIEWVLIATSDARIRFRNRVKTRLRNLIIKLIRKLCVPMVTYDIGITICGIPGYIKSQLSPLVPDGHNSSSMTDKLDFSSN